MLSAEATRVQAVAAISVLVSRTTTCHGDVRVASRRRSPAPVARAAGCAGLCQSERFPEPAPLAPQAQSGEAPRNVATSRGTKLAVVSLVVGFVRPKGALRTRSRASLHECSGLARLFAL